jgi:ribosome-associated translation inhibitor RaiA
MITDIQARGFTLTDALRGAVECEVQAYANRFPDHLLGVHVRLFDVNGPRGGTDKGCLVYGRFGRGGAVVVATDIAADLYDAIPAAFGKLNRATRNALARRQALRRTSGWPAGAAPLTE